MHTDVKSAHRTDTGTVVSGRVRLMGLVLTNGASAGSAIFRDGGASGTVLLTVVTPASAGITPIDVPSGGILFKTDVHVTVSNVTGVTIFHG